VASAASSWTRWALHGQQGVVAEEQGDQQGVDAVEHAAEAGKDRARVLTAKSA
jgi:hypothetical protein